MSTTPTPDLGDPVDRLLRTTAERWREQQDGVDEPSYDDLLARAVGSSPGRARPRSAPALASSWRVAAVAASVLVLVGGVVGIVGSVRGHDRGSVSSPAADASPALPSSRVLDGKTVGLRGLSPVHMLVSGGPTSAQLTLHVDNLGAHDECHSGEVAEVVSQDDDSVTVTVGRYGPAPTQGEGPYACPAYDAGTHSQVLELAAPLGTRTVVDGSTGRPIPVLDASSTPYPTQTLDAPYVLKEVAPGPVVTWLWMDHTRDPVTVGSTVTLRPSAPVPPDETDFGEQKFGDRTVRISANKETITARWREDATHAWMITVEGGGDVVKDGVVVDYSWLPQLVSTFTSPG